MSSRYTGTADCSYRYIIRKINEDTRLSRKKKDELIHDVDYMVGHLIDDFDFHLRNQYSCYHSLGEDAFKKTRGFFFFNPKEYIRDMLLNVMKRALSSVTWEHKKFKEAGFIERL